MHNQTRHCDRESAKTNKPKNTTDSDGGGPQTLKLLDLGNVGLMIYDICNEIKEASHILQKNLKF